MRKSVRGTPCPVLKCVSPIPEEKEVANAIVMSCNRYQKLYFWLRQRYMFRAILVLLLPFISPHLIKAQTVPEPTSIPELTSIAPQGGQRGTNVEIAFKGKNISKATALLFSGEGISGEIGEKTGEAAVCFLVARVYPATSPMDSRLVAQITIAPNAALGMREVRLVTPKGVSNAQPFVVGDLPEVGEIEPNSEPNAANWINLPTTVTGVIDSVDDQDFFRFNAKAEQRLICDVTASRMGSLLDSFLALFGPDGVEIASNDMANGFDSLIDYTIPMEGEYTLRIRDLRYKGGEEFIYRLSVGETALSGFNISAGREARHRKTPSPSVAEISQMWCQCKYLLPQMHRWACRTCG